MSLFSCRTHHHSPRPTLTAALSSPFNDEVSDNEDDEKEDDFECGVLVFGTSREGEGATTESETQDELSF
ncbi:MAG: hypothetical protein QNL33_19150 [Akkermansiaceae bacterium]